MAIKIQLRRDIASNWTDNNPLLLNGEVGIETDTLKFKVGNGTQRWNSLSSYGLKPGEPNGVATLNSDSKIPISQIPDLDCLYDVSGSAALAFTDAKADANTKMNQAITTAATDATNKLNQAISTSTASAEVFTNTAINSLTTSDIEEGSRLYFTTQRVSDIVDPLIISTRSYVDTEIAAIPPQVLNTSDITEGSKLFFTTSRAISANAGKHNEALSFTASSVNDLRTEIEQSIASYVPDSERNVSNGFAGLDSDGLIQSTVIPSTIARTSDITSAIANVVNLAPESLDTLGELATALQEDQSGLSALVTTVGTKLDSSIAATTYAPIDSPTFTGTPVIPGYATTINLTAALTEAKAYTDTATNGINNSLGDYALTADRNIAGGYAGLDSNSQILESAIPSAITTSLAAKASINGTYTNGNSSSNPNKITYGTNLTPPSSGNSAGDIYIQY